MASWESILANLLPEGLSVGFALLLVLSSFFTSALTAAIGLGGGVILIVIMASLVPASALVPVHGAVQLGSNAGRALVQLRHVDWGIAAWFALGAIFGALAGGAIAIQLSEAALKSGIALFILWTVWGRPPKFEQLAKPVMGVTGFISAFLSMFFGAAGPIGGAMLATLGLTRHQFVANQAITALMMHIFKLLAFGLLGFALAPWLPLIFAMIATGFLGTLTGSKLLGKMDEVAFKKGFKIVMTGLALHLIWKTLL